MPETLTRRDLNRATLARQLLLERADVGVVEAVERLAGLQAQEPRPPFVGLWSRLAGFAPQDLVAALQDGRLVRATLMRGTLHLASAAHYAAMRPALAPVLADGLRVLGTRAKGLDPKAVLAVARELLAAEPRTFDELRGLLQERFPDVNERALGYCVRMLMPLTMVPSDDRWGFPRVARFTPADVATEGDAAALVRPYLAAFGPAGAADLATWSGLGATAALLDGLRDELAVFADEHGRELFDLPDAPRPGADAPAPPRLLPDFDNLVLAHKDRTRVLADEHRAAVVTKNLRVRATFLVDGEVAGTWKLERDAVVLEPFGRLRAADRRALEDEGDQLRTALT
jgi:hypothetical protein